MVFPALTLMAKQRAPLAVLPRAEVCAYWVLSLGSHLYSFYQLHIVSKEYEAGLEREFQLEKGFLIWGYKKDPTDFEWSFWSHWAGKSLLWTLLGHAVISRVACVFFPKFRVTALAAYGLLAAYSALGIKGVGVVLVHLGLSLAVAQLCKPALSWSCALLLLYTLHIPQLQEIQRSWYQTEEEYYLLLFSVAVCGLRFISFSLERCCRPLEAGGLQKQLYWLTAYSFYHPLFYNGPILTFNDFLQQTQTPMTECGGRRTCLSLLANAGRICVWWLIAEYMIHFMYMHTIQANETYLEILPPWALGGLALALVQFFYVKYLVLFGVPSLLAELDGLAPPKLPRCVSIMHSFTGMWRHFDVGLYYWLIRYIYIPLGGSRHGLLWKMLSTALAFGFVCLWHGGHDYLQYWAIMNWLGVLVENGMEIFLSSPLVYPLIERHISPAMRRRCLALLSASSTALLILSNLIFLGGTHVGRIMCRRVFIQGWCTVAPPMLAFLYCFAQIGLEWESNPP
ncbi:protein-cysteine N-palmitoyltransferase HHAT isoform X3 [Esox lucius]|uniref:Hedgehog acyltransferase n=1 Tax=Esox lucius TaxID=8010 RepID=A0A3P8Z9S3_ESOLU|nr:protein-cysteine N-palmitoyltransferase HHAT isoform X3 [Esox lucius]